MASKRSALARHRRRQEAQQGKAEDGGGGGGGGGGGALGKKEQDESDAQMNTGVAFFSIRQAATTPPAPAQATMAVPAIWMMGLLQRPAVHCSRAVRQELK